MPRVDTIIDNVFGCDIDRAQAQPASGLVLVYMERIDLAMPESRFRVDMAQHQRTPMPSAFALRNQMPTSISAKAAATIATRWRP